MLGDRALVIEYTDRATELVAPWLPMNALALPSSDGARAVIRVSADDAARVTDFPADSRPALRLGATAATFTNENQEIDPHSAKPHADVRLAAPSGVRGTIDFASMRCEASMNPATATEDDAGSFLMLASALLLNRMGAALVHAGATVDPDGRAWLIAGDTHAGKTTACISLVSAGWGFLADDNVVLRRDDRGDLFVEGWPRIAHVDRGWSRGEITGEREDVVIQSMYPDSWRSSARLGGVVMPTVRADSPTFASNATQSEALTALIRQSPWLMFDRHAASDVLALLSAAAAQRAIALSSGSNSYGRGEVLRDILTRAIAAG